MSWERPEFSQYIKYVDIVRVGASMAKGGCLRIAMGRNVWRKLGWNPGLRVEIEYGAGSDEGWIRLMLSANGRTALTFNNSQSKDGSLIAKTNRTIPRLAPEVPTTECKYVITPGGDLLIKLPGEFWQKYQQRKPYKPKVLQRLSTEMGDNSVDKIVERSGLKKNGLLTV